LAPESWIFSPPWLPYESGTHSSNTWLPSERPNAE
jgi:hypothetical protein